MTSRTPLLLVTLLSTSLTAATAALADPPNTTVTFDYRANPHDIDSSIVFSVTLHLSPASTSGSNVGWQITSAEFYQPQFARTWTTGAISVIGGSGGLWWVTHANINSPLASEFTAIPHIEGSAECTNEQVPDLNFSLQQGTTELEPEEYPHGNQTGFSSHSFQLDGEPEPEEEGNGEPVDIHFA